MYSPPRDIYGLADPADERVKKLPEFHSWVAQGGLVEFAKAHNVEPDFADRLHDFKPAITIAYYAKLRTIPGLETVMSYNTFANMKTMSWESAQETMALAEGWNEEEEEEEEKKEEEKKEEEKKEAKEAAPSYVVNSDQYHHSSPYCPKLLWSSPVKRGLASAKSSPIKR
ncbi:hypothetical protein P153DRAFT_391242 [Dothidotthia symphoricarpi CBS 119687]|uniref:Uncharacterized protein n=1 Tax=Dothidotthia symphoricarpi CBS 119687 TaxID=1392245 RepID=A0A6A5ZXR7_9PLEO|nr:uncharacterized protein P153DRAFT_391242 [Dothidotthia symphoricarpi CBS 119687]KAF2123815.1 hypothetical protein P153DRAFT_391242 [Dothidotthia symphoricarpi CBS 119687]